MSFHAVTNIICRGINATGRLITIQVISYYSVCPSVVSPHPEQQKVPELWKSCSQALEWLVPQSGRYFPAYWISLILYRLPTHAALWDSTSSCSLWWYFKDQTQVWHADLSNTDWHKTACYTVVSRPLSCQLGDFTQILEWDAVILRSFHLHIQLLNQPFSFLRQLISAHNQWFKAKQ